MRIVQVTPGTGGNFYCDNCLRDVALVRALQKQGHDVLMMPMYLPVQIEGEETPGDAPIFFGGVNVYLQQKSGFFRKSPRWIDWFLDRRSFLRWIGRKSDMTSAKDLGEMTVSMLRSEEGRQAKELDRLVEWLRGQVDKPDVVLLSNALLAGLAKHIRERVGVPVLCLLQDEDGFLDALGEPYSTEAWELLRKRVADIDGFMAASKYYLDVMHERLKLSGERAHVVYTGIPVDGCVPAESRPEVPTIGFLSRMCFNKGLDTLVDAFVTLRKNTKLDNARLRIAGGKNRSDEGFVSEIRGRLEACGLIDDVEFVPSFDRETRLGFLRTLSVLCVPERRPVAYAVYALEAMAAGVPVVEPATGVFQELLEITGGGILYDAKDTDGLASALERVLLDANYGRELGNRGREVVFAKFNVDQTARELVHICEGAVRRFRRG
ncbi:MAG: glycosyltransferase family 4 protein [Planctomycetota bacterium]|jgi:glycosyltransferase involved in cell wall biosynthesis